MLVTSTPLEYARERLLFWEMRLATAERMPMGMGSGGWPSQKAKAREVAVCHGAIQALKELIEVEYTP